MPLLPAAEAKVAVAIPRDISLQLPAKASRDTLLTLSFERQGQGQEERQTKQPGSHAMSMPRLAERQEDSISNFWGFDAAKARRSLLREQMERNRAGRGPREEARKTGSKQTVLPQASKLKSLESLLFDRDTTTAQRETQPEKHPLRESALPAENSRSLPLKEAAASRFQASRAKKKP